MSKHKYFNMIKLLKITKYNQDKYKQLPSEYNTISYITQQ